MRDPVIDARDNEVGFGNTVVMHASFCGFYSYFFLVLLCISRGTHTRCNLYLPVCWYAGKLWYQWRVVTGSRLVCM